MRKPMKKHKVTRKTKSGKVVTYTRGKGSGTDKKGKGKEFEKMKSRLGNESDEDAKKTMGATVTLTDAHRYAYLSAKSEGRHYAPKGTSLAERNRHAKDYALKRLSSPSKMKTEGLTRAHIAAMKKQYD